MADQVHPSVSAEASKEITSLRDIRSAICWGVMRAHLLKLLLWASFGGIYVGMKLTDTKLPLSVLESAEADVIGSGILIVSLLVAISLIAMTVARRR